MTHCSERTQAATINIPENNRDLVVQAANETACAVKLVLAIDVYSKPIHIGLKLIEDKDYTQFWIRLNKLRKAAGLPYFE